MLSAGIEKQKSGDKQIMCAKNTVVSKRNLQNQNDINFSPNLTVIFNQGVVFGSSTPCLVRPLLSVHDCLFGV